MTQIYLTGFVIDKDINKWQLTCTIEMDVEIYVLQ